MSSKLTHIRKAIDPNVQHNFSFVFSTKYSLGFCRFCFKIKKLEIYCSIFMHSQIKIKKNTPAPPINFYPLKPLLKSCSPFSALWPACVLVRCRTHERSLVESSWARTKNPFSRTSRITSRTSLSLRPSSNCLPRSPKIVRGYLGDNIQGKLYGITEDMLQAVFNCVSDFRDVLIKVIKCGVDLRSFHCGWQVFIMLKLSLACLPETFPSCTYNVQCHCHYCSVLSKKRSCYQLISS